MSTGIGEKKDTSQEELLKKSKEETTLRESLLKQDAKIEELSKQLETAKQQLSKVAGDELKKRKLLILNVVFIHLRNLYEHGWCQTCEKIKYEGLPLKADMEGTKIKLNLKDFEKENFPKFKNDYVWSRLINDFKGFFFPDKKYDFYIDIIVDKGLRKTFIKKQVDKIYGETEKVEKQKNIWENLLDRAAGELSTEESLSKKNSEDTNTDNSKETKTVPRTLYDENGKFIYEHVLRFLKRNDHGIKFLILCNDIFLLRMFLLVEVRRAWAVVFEKNKDELSKSQDHDLDDDLFIDYKKLEKIRLERVEYNPSTEALGRLRQLKYWGRTNAQKRVKLLVVLWGSAPFDRARDRRENIIRRKDGAAYVGSVIWLVKKLMELTVDNIDEIGGRYGYPNRTRRRKAFLWARGQKANTELAAKMQAFDVMGNMIWSIYTRIYDINMIVGGSPLMIEELHQFDTDMRTRAYTDPVSARDDDYGDKESSAMDKLAQHMRNTTSKFQTCLREAEGFDGCRDDLSAQLVTETTFEAVKEQRLKKLKIILREMLMHWRQFFHINLLQIDDTERGSTVQGERRKGSLLRRGKNAEIKKTEIDKTFGKRRNAGRRKRERDDADVAPEPSYPYTNEEQDTPYAKEMRARQAYDYFKNMLDWVNICIYNFDTYDFKTGYSLENDEDQFEYMQDEYNPDKSKNTDKAATSKTPKKKPSIKSLFSGRKNTSEGQGVEMTDYTQADV
jgi:hypothetical protein